MMRWRFRVQLEYLGAIAPPFEPWNATRYRQRNEKAPALGPTSPGRFQGSWPVSRSWSKPSSSRSGIPRSVALESFAPPGSAPTTTAVVF